MISIGHSQDWFECTWSRVGDPIEELVDQGGFGRI